MDDMTNITPSYEFNSKRKKPGCCIILNHTVFANLPPRNGTALDVALLKTTFGKMGFEVIIYHDLATKDIRKNLKKCAEQYNAEEADCLAVVVLTHGGYQGKLYSKDGYYHKSLLWRPFLRDNCPGLNGKPKLFFIQACRGYEMDNGVTIRTSKTDSSGDSYHQIPPEPHFCIFYSTIEGQYSWRNTTQGSWFINVLCQELQSTDDGELDLMKIMLRVSYRVAMERESSTEENTPEMNGMKQMPSIVSTLTKKICLRITKERFHKGGHDVHNWNGNTAYSEPCIV